MDISARTEYAVRAMLILAEASATASGPVSVESLALRQVAAPQVPRGDRRRPRRRPGAQQPRAPAAATPWPAPADIILGDVFRAVDGPLAEVRGLRPHETQYEGVAEHLPTVWVAVRASLRSVLDETSLADVLSGELPERVAALAADPDAWRNR